MASPSSGSSAAPAPLGADGQRGPFSCLFPFRAYRLVPLAKCYALAVSRSLRSTPNGHLPPPQPAAALRVLATLAETPLSETPNAVIDSSLPFSARSDPLRSRGGSLPIVSRSPVFGLRAPVSIADRTAKPPRRFANSIRTARFDPPGGSGCRLESGEQFASSIRTATPKDRLWLT